MVMPLRTPGIVIMSGPLSCGGVKARMLTELLCEVVLLAGQVAEVAVEAARGGEQGRRVVKAQMPCRREGSRR